MLEIVGREEELASLHAFIGEMNAGPAALVLEGEAGIGKSTLWFAGVEHAHARGLRVLSSRPAEAERRLAHVGLGDLLEEVRDEILPALPAPRRSALEVALLLAETGERAPDARAVGAAALTGLRALAETRPLLLAVDDVQWLDASSASVLEFALRRLRDDPILVLLARRRGEGGPMPERALPPDVITRREVGPLSLEGTHQLLRLHLGRAFPQPTLTRIHETSGGKPFLALELARALHRRGRPLAAR